MNKPDAMTAWFDEMDSQPEHEVRWILGRRVDIWKDAETGHYVANIQDSMTSGTSAEDAATSAEAIIVLEAQMAIMASWQKDLKPGGEDSSHGK